MIKPRIVVTGATGKTGSVVATELLQAGYPVRAVVHREDGRSARLKVLGAEIVVVEMSDVERVVEALDGVQRAYYCPPIDPYAIQEAVAFAIAAKEARLEHIVGLTQWLASPLHPSLMTRQSWLTERLFSMTPGSCQSNRHKIVVGKEPRVDDRMRYYYVEDHKNGAFESGAPTTDVLDVTGRPPEDFETIARRYAAQPRNQPTLSN
jgi:NAD(P)-dependent dehydrogenase (short-subunit alcohol dehydrogenase family)